MKYLINELAKMISEKEQDFHNQCREIKRTFKGEDGTIGNDPYVKIDRLYASEEYILVKGFTEAGLSDKRFKAETKAFRPYSFPKALEEFVRWRFGITDERVARYFGEGLFTIDPGESSIIADLIEDELLPEIFLRFIKFDEYDGEIKGFLGAFAQPTGTEDSEIILVDHEDRKMYVVSHGFENFFSRGLQCLKAGKEQNYFYPDEEVERIIRSVDGEDVLPTVETGRTVFFLDNEDEWPKHWLK